MTPPLEKTVEDSKTLLVRARDCLERAYAPYSQFPVAAAVIDEVGRVFTGINIENASYSLTICAERVAIFVAIAAGARRIKGLALTSNNVNPLMPCGACRQVMAEFCDPETPIYCDTGGAEPMIWTLQSLLPEAFSAPDGLGKMGQPHNLK